MTSARELLENLGNLAQCITQMGGANSRDCQEIRTAALDVLRENGIRPKGRIKAARELKACTDALSGLLLLSDYLEIEESGDDAAAAKAMLELESARTSLTRKVEALVAIVCQPLK